MGSKLFSLICLGLELVSWPADPWRRLQPRGQLSKQTCELILRKYKYLPTYLRSRPIVCRYRKFFPKFLSTQTIEGDRLWFWNTLATPNIGRNRLWIRKIWSDPTKIVRITGRICNTANQYRQSPLSYITCFFFEKPFIYTINAISIKRQRKRGLFS